ncbi:MAG: heme o synthase, partial [Anaerolineae bacterium]
MAHYLALFKLRIGLMVAFSAVAASLAAPGSPSPQTVVFLAVVTLCAAAGSGALNNYLDRDIDRVMERTQGRLLPCGKVPPGAVLWTGIVLLLGSLVAALLINLFVSLHLALGSFAYVVLYTLWLKRRTPWNIVIGGLAGSFAILAGGAAVEGGASLTLTSASLALVLFLWTPPHFWSLAILRKEEYREARIPMLPVVAGEEKAARWILGHTLGMVALSLVPYWQGSLGTFYLIAALGAGALFLARNLQLLL